MPILLYSCIITVSLVLCLYFFRKTAGTLHVGRLNLISISLYLFIVQVFTGTALAMLGLDRHYTLRRLINHQQTINTLFYVVMVVSVVWPLSMWFFMKLFRVDPKKDYQEYLTKPTLHEGNNLTFWIVLISGGLCLGLLAVYLSKIGYIPLMRLLQPPNNFSFATARIKINNLDIINIYIRNILILLAIPVISYVTFAYAITTHKVKWIVLTVLFFAAAIITKTYNFEKAPIILHLMVYVLIIIYYKGGIRTKWMIPIFIAGAIVMFALYMQFAGSIQISLYNGIGGRMLYSQVGALASNFDVFPNTFPYLMGRSVSATVLKLLNIDPALHLRSARLLMEFYAPREVYEGVAGVMNSFFIGEAYANFGWAGAIFSVLWTGFVLAGLFTLTMKIRKTPITLAITAYFSIFAAITTHGGFMDFIFNISWFLVLGILLLLEYWRDIPDAVNKLTRRNR